MKRLKWNSNNTECAQVKTAYTGKNAYIAFYYVYGILMYSFATSWRTSHYGTLNKKKVVQQLL
jgi:hypothetical protein